MRITKLNSQSGISDNDDYPVDSDFEGLDHSNICSRDSSADSRHRSIFSPSRPAQHRSQAAGASSASLRGITADFNSLTLSSPISQTGSTSRPPRQKSRVEVWSAAFDDSSESLAGDTDTEGSVPSSQQSSFSFFDSRTKSSASSTSSIGSGVFSNDDRPHTPRKALAPPVHVSARGPQIEVPDIIYGGGTEFSVIAHNTSVQREMDYRAIPWTIQFELARRVSNHTLTWDDLTSDILNSLRGPYLDSLSRLRNVLLSGKLKTTDQTLPAEVICEELAREQLAIQENCSRGLGLMDDWEGESDWYGGRIQQVVSLVDTGDRSSLFSLRLSIMESTKSSRISRFLGSRRLIQVRVPKDILQKAGEKVKRSLKRKFILCGRVFVPFHAKDNSVFLMETNEDYDRRADPSCGDHHRLSLRDFMEWANPLSVNFKQPISKWSTRLSLGLSTSVPVLEFKPENIFLIDDLVYDPSKAKSETHEIYTDGCGFMNESALAHIGQRLSLNRVPLAVQGRVAGSKGVWVLHPEHRSLDEEPMIWIRSSQKKISFPSFPNLHRAHLIFDLVAPNRITAPSRLNYQKIINLSHNGVPNETFEFLAKLSMEEFYDKLTDWDSPSSMARLWDTVDRAGKVTSMRLHRQAGGVARALGLGQSFSKDADVDPTAGEFYEDVSDQSPGYDLSGPESAHEEAMELIQAGFRPLENELLYDKLKVILKFMCEDSMAYHIPLEESAEAFGIPDPLGKLAENEIYFHPSVIGKVITGDVLISRNPTRVASDIQKVHAVNDPAYAAYTDLIIFPVKGRRSLASWLGGGDYDGDVYSVFWCSELVDPFRNAALALPVDNFEAKNFEKQVIFVNDFCDSVQKLPPFEAQKQLLSVLMLGLTQPLVGLYSHFHDRAVYYLGYEHIETTRLAFMFNTCLDSGKTGLRVVTQVYQQDSRKYNGKKVPCFTFSTASEDGPDQSNRKRLSPRPFILDLLINIMNAEKDVLMQRFEDLSNSVDFKAFKDPDLCRQYLNAKDYAERANRRGMEVFISELRLIEQHVQGTLKSWRIFWSRNRQTSQKKLSAKAESELLAIKKSLFIGPEPPDGGFFTLNIPTISASYLYLQAPSSAFRMASRELCNVKASSSSHSVTVRREVMEVMAVKSTFVRLTSLEGTIS